MEVWLIYTMYYFCIALSFGIATSITILRQASGICREIISENHYNIADTNTFVVYTTWIFLVTVLFPICIYPMLSRLEELIPEVAVGLIKTEDEMY